ncbi:Novel D-mannonate dehydrogenase [hydrothermal vent metagenome]|uniref:Novel D-mannonate dehydrogenase n=1 Tax=hydrothermal vent metagenome TaxID=652676 RepID=A0A3B1DP22_9ZZZZ
MSSSVATMTEAAVQKWIATHLPDADFADKKVLLIIPDHTRTAPLPLLFDAIFNKLNPLVKQLDVMVALGTHAEMSQEKICELLGISSTDRVEKYKDVQLLNHEWKNEDRLSQIGILTKEQTEAVSNGMLSLEVPIKINARIHDYDLLQVLGPVFPHEVVGFSGGDKYFFPGISGPELLNFFHWLGALITNVGIIGVKETPVRAVVDMAAKMIPVERRFLTFVVDPQANLYGMFYGEAKEAWEQAADLSSTVHIKRYSKAFHTILSCSPPMYDELWTAGKCMYKLEPVVADGGELIIYAPHLSEISEMHGDVISKIGYHVRDYFLKQWDKFKHYPWGVLAHSTHVRGSGTYENGIEQPRVQVTLASQVPPEVCKSLNLSYRDPATIDVESYANREEEGVLLVRKAGEHLYRLEE